MCAFVFDLLLLQCLCVFLNYSKFRESLVTFGGRRRIDRSEVLRLRQKIDKYRQHHATWYKSPHQHHRNTFKNHSLPRIQLASKSLNKLFKID